MGTMWDKISNDLQDAMRAKNEFATSVLRMLLAALKNKKIEIIGGGQAENLNDSQVNDVIKTEVKKRKDSAAVYEQGNRFDLAEKEKKEIAVLEKYLPEQMGDDELEKTVRAVISSIPDAGPKDFGRVMGQVVPRIKGRADGARISAAVKKILGA